MSAPGSSKQPLTYFVNAFSCVETGAALVGANLLRAAGPRRVFAIVPDNAFWRGRRPPEYQRWFYLGRFAGRKITRLCLEALIWTCRRNFGSDVQYINMANYGVGMLPNDVLYFQNVSLLERDPRDTFRPGTGNFVTDVLLRSALSHAGRVVTQSEETNVRLLAWFAGTTSPARRGPPCISLTPVPVAAPRVSRAAPRLPGETLTLFYPASDFRHKRTDLAIDAVRLHNRTRGHERAVQLAITCNGVSDEEVRCLGRITHDEVLEWYAKSDALLFTSEREALGLPLLEALAAHLPGVVPTLPYAERVYGDAAAYFDTFEPAAVVAAIRRLMRDHDALRNCAAERERSLAHGRVGWAEHWDYFEPVQRPKNEPIL